jgi:CHAD domain-containing protein
MADYLLPEGMTIQSAARTIVSQLAVRDGRMASTQRLYYDTFDGLLHAAGLMAVWENGWLSLNERSRDRTTGRVQIPKPTQPVFAWELPPGALAHSVQALIGVRALLPLADIRSRERALEVLNRDEKTVVRLRIQQPVAGRHRLQGRVHVVAVRGYDQAYKRVTDTLSTEMGFEVGGPVLDEALLSSGRTPEGISSKVDVHLNRDQPADVAVGLVLGALAQVIRNNLDGAIADLDTEFLHDLRVAVRRSRAVQRQFRAIFPTDDLARFRSQFRWLQQITGETRDLDVHVLEFDQMLALLSEASRTDLEPLRGVLQRRRQDARARMRRALRSPRAHVLLDDWAEFLDRLPALEDRPAAKRPIRVLANERIGKVYERMVRTGGTIGPLSPPEDYHELRKLGKELRYLLELFGLALYPAEAVRPTIKALKALQDVLGRHQDREIQVATLRSLGPEVAAASGGAEALMAMGVLAERLEADKVSAKEAFAERFSGFASSDQRRLVRDTFR